MALSKEEKNKIIKDFGTHAQDSGSTEVQIALLTHDILALTEHCKTHKKDNSSRRGLLQMVCDRTKYLQYLKKNSEAKYKEIIARLGLRK